MVKIDNCLGTASKQNALFSEDVPQKKRTHAPNVYNRPWSDWKNVPRLE